MCGSGAVVVEVVRWWVCGDGRSRWAVVVEVVAVVVYIDGGWWHWDGHGSCEMLAVIMA